MGRSSLAFTDLIGEKDPMHKTHSSPSSTPFSRGRRKIAPFEIPDHPGTSATSAALDLYAMEKAAILNQHVIGYGRLAENEWSALRLDPPDMQAARRYRLT